MDKLTILYFGLIEEFIYLDKEVARTTLTGLEKYLQKKEDSLEWKN